MEARFCVQGLTSFLLHGIFRQECLLVLHDAVKLVPSAIPQVQTLPLAVLLVFCVWVLSALALAGSQ